MPDATPSMLLGSDDLLAAFREIDTICRRSRQATAQQYHLRALCFLALGLSDEARRDLDRGLHSDGVDLDILTSLIDADPAFARAVVAHPWSGSEASRCAARRLVPSQPLVLHAARTLSGVSGVVLTPSGRAPTVSIDGIPVDTSFRVAGRHSPHVNWHRFESECPQPDAVRVSAVLGSTEVVEVLPPAAMDARRRFSEPGVISVLVPIYGGREATRACLSALSTQRCSRRIEVVLVEDASPDRDLVSDAAAIAAERGWQMLRNRLNVGFAGSVNAAARCASGADLLLLNADAILPDGAIDGLLAAACHPGVGTVVPFSNDGGFTSFPKMSVCNPDPSGVDGARIAAAFRSGLRPPIDIPAGTAFCMLVTGECWDVLGGLDLGYRRGYFEDVDLCLRARRRGFRNVIAPSVYVRHLGGQSFGASKRALVADNAHLLVDRFPEYDSDWTSFVEADPLGPVRGAVERRLPPLSPVHLIVGCGLCPSTIPDHAMGGGRALRLRWDDDGRLCLAADDGDLPQSLAFAADEGDELRSYLRGLDLRGLIISDVSIVQLDRLLNVLPAAIPVTLAVTGPRALRLLEERHPLLARAWLFATDAMGAAALGSVPAPLPAPSEPSPGPVRIAALAPLLTVAADRLCHRLDRHLRPHGGSVTIFGAGLGERGGCAATGPMPEADYVSALAHRRITHVLLPDADTPFRLVEAVRASNGLPAAYFDWSGRRHNAAVGDLALAETGAGPSNVDALIAWCLVDPRPRGSAA